MAKKFGGFTPQQQQTLLSKMGYTGPAQQDDLNKFMMSSPKAASMMGKYAEMAKARVQGGQRMAMNVGGLSQEEQMKMFNQANQNAVQQQPTQFATASTNSNETTTAQSSYTPTQQADTLIRAGQPSTHEATPEQMAAQQQAQTQANAAQLAAMQPQMQEVPADVQQRLDSLKQEQDRIGQAMQEKFGERGKPDDYVPEFSSKMKALQDNMKATQNAFMKSKGIAEGDFGAMNRYMQSNPNAQEELKAALQSDQQQVDALTQQLDDNPEFKAYQTEVRQYQQSLEDEIKKRGGEYRGGPALPVQPPSLYSGDITNQTLQDILAMSTGATPVDLQYDFNQDGKITSDDALQAGKIGEGRGTVSQGTDAGGLYDPSQGLPTAPELKEVNALDFFKQNTGGGYYLPDYNETALAGLVNEGSDLSGATAEGNTVTFADGKTITTKSPEEAAQVVTAAGAYTTEVVQPNKTAQDTYNKQLDQYKSYYGDQATVTPEGTRADYDTAQSGLSKEQNLLQSYTTQLTNMAADDPQRTTLEGLIEEQKIKVTNAQFGLAQAKTNLERVGMPSTTEMRADALEDPTSMVTKADVVTVTDEQRAAGKIAEGTGQAAAEAAKATLTTADIADDVVAPIAKDAATYDATTVSGKAKAELDKVKAATLDEFSDGVIFEGEEGELSEGAYADEALKVAADRIQKVNEKVDLEVTKEQLAEAKGKNLTAIQTKVAKSSALLDAVAKSHVVQPNELPTPQLIAEEDMAQAKAMTDTGLDKDAIPIAAKMASFSVDNGTLAKAAQGDVDSLATVEGQLGKLMKQFDDGTPAWAAGAIRAANAAMASRGLGASSMAGAAILQAAMESALPIAQQDAKTFADMGMQNLDNRQQVAVANAAAQQGLQLQNLDNEQKANLQKSINAFGLQTQNLSNRQAAEVANAQIRATLQGQNLNNRQQANIAEAARYAEAANINLNNKQQAAMQDNSNALQTNLAELSAEQSAYINSANAAAALQGQVLSNDQQVSISNAARFSEAANIEFTAEQQNALHNSKLMSSIGLAELSATQAATLQNAASVANMDITNLNNRQQAAVQNAKAFLQKDMTNLSNEQQIAVFKAQATQQALLSDQAAENAAKQFNAASQNQTNQFYDNLSTQVAMQNQEQTNAMNKFNAGEANAISVANTAHQNRRDEFNANNALVLEQANTQWEQSITTMDNAAQNTANRDSAIVANNLTETTYNNMLQQERDALDYAVRIADREDQQEHALTLEGLSSDAAASAAKGSAVGTVIATVSSLLLKDLF
jgi:hypothetical protein